MSLIQPTGPASYRPAARAAARLTRLLLRQPERGATLLNVNVPPGQPRGVKLTRLGRRLYSEKVVERHDPRGRRYFWIGVGPPAWEAGEDTDYAAVHAGYVSVTPLMLDLTDYPGPSGAEGLGGAVPAGAARAGNPGRAMTGGRAVGTGAGWQEARAARERERMVEEQLVRRGVTDARVLDAMRRIPRHRFVEEALRDRAYGDHPLPIGENQTISQPYIVGMMTQLLALNGSEKVLEIGTGSGYQTAVLAELVRRVCSVERLMSLAVRRAPHPGGVGVY